MNEQIPLVSIIIPTRNRPDFLKDAIVSVVKQTYDNWELIIVDDAASGMLPTQLASVVKDARINLRNREGIRHGAPVCRNQGLKIAQGDHMIFLDDDDCLDTFCLKNRVAAMNKRTELDFVIFPCGIFHRSPGDLRLLHNIKTAQDDLVRFMLLDTPWQTASPIWRRSAIEKNDLWNEELPSFQDWDFHVRALVAGLRYEWAGDLPDCYWRLPVNGENTVGVRSQSAQHLGSHLRLFLQTVSDLRDAGLLEDGMKNVAAGLFFWLAEAWLRLDNHDEAMSVWEKCRVLISIEEDVYRRGCMVLKSPYQMLLRRSLRKLFLFPYPSFFRSGDYSRTSRRCRYDVSVSLENAG